MVLPMILNSDRALGQRWVDGVMVCVVICGGVICAVQWS
jgi:hypothetical protein